jgi:hypothetical protein
MIIGTPCLIRIRKTTKYHEFDTVSRRSLDIPQNSFDLLLVYRGRAVKKLTNTIHDKR